MGMGCGARSFAVAGSRRGKPLKSRVANFSEKKGTLLLRFSGCEWDVVAGVLLYRGQEEVND